METLTARTSRVFRIDQKNWRRLAVTGTLAGAASVAIGAYGLLAFDRLGIQGVVEPKSAVRLLLIGFYGWMWLAAAAWATGRLALGIHSEFVPVLRLYGNAHLPLLFVGIAIQVFSVVGRTLGPALLVAVVAVLFWMPIMLTGATREAFSVDVRRAALLVAGPFLVWLVTVGRYLLTQLGHLL